MSATYILYSLDGDKFRQLVERPTPEQLASLASLLHDGLEEHDGEFDEGDPILSWPTDISSLAPIVAKRLAQPDWYRDLSTPGKTLWEGVIFNACLHCDDLDLGFRAEHDGISSDVIDLALQQRDKTSPSQPNSALLTFGTRPYRCQLPPGKTVSSQARDQAEADKRASLGALSQMLGQFMEGAKQGKKDPTKQMDELDNHQGVSREHTNLLKNFLHDEESPEDDNDWSSMHSMHTPDEVRQLQTELKSLAPAMKAIKKKKMAKQYEEELLPAIDKVASEGRMLLIQVDS